MVILHSPQPATAPTLSAAYSPTRKSALCEISLPSQAVDLDLRNIVHLYHGKKGVSPLSFPFSWPGSESVFSAQDSVPTAKVTDKGIGQKYRHL